MTECATSQALACAGEECAERRWRWGRTTAGQLFKSGFEIPMHGDKTVVAESGAWCNDLQGRCHKGELR
jgi:hypothetical protein